MLCLSYHFFKIKVSNGSEVESLETQVQACLFLLLSDATSTPCQFLIFHPQGEYVNMHPHTNLYTLFSNNPNQNIIHERSFLELSSSEDFLLSSSSSVSLVDIFTSSS
ncbi:1772_t:CDS:2, partial [Cetraspora pellucida]